MRNTVLLSLTGLALLASGATAANAAHPRRAEVNARLENQHDRIQAGVASGQLTHAEAHRLRREDRTIRGEERAMARFDGDHLTRADQRALNQQENRASRQIYRARHN